jgi:polysaccharide export outer membrane protein
MLFSMQMLGQQTRPVLQATPAAVEPAQAPAAAQTPPQVSSDSYIIGPGDVLQLSVWKEPSMSNPNVPVRPDGDISLALLGDVPAAGVTPMTLGKDIALRLKKYVNDPLVTITVLNVQPKQIYLIGEIGHTGAIVLTPDMTVLQAIAAGGGLTPYAKKKLYILRKGPGKETKIPFDFKKAFRDGDQQGVTLRAGDTIVVP